MKLNFRRRKTFTNYSSCSSSTLVELDIDETDDENNEASPLSTTNTTAIMTKDDDENDHCNEPMTLSSSNNNSNKAARSIPPFVLKATAIASLGGILFGYDMGVISGALPQLTNTFDLQQTQQQWVVGVLYLGGGFGATIGGPLCDVLGRKTAILLTDVIFMVGATIMACAFETWQLVVGRIVMGMGIAISGIADVAFLNEMAPKQWRGSIVSVNEACISLGFLIAYGVGYALSNKPNGWRGMFGLSGVLAFGQLVGMLGMPESPLWLKEKGRLQESQEALQRIYGKNIGVHGAAIMAGELGDEQVASWHAASSIKSISSSRHAFVTHDSVQSIHQDNDDGNKKNNDVGVIPMCKSLVGAWRILACTLGRYYKQAWIALFLAVGQQLSGQTNVLNYAPLIFGQFNQEIAMSSTVWIGIVKFITTVVVIWRIEFMGRRNLLLAGMALIVLGQVLLTCAFVMGTVVNESGEMVPSNAEAGMYLALPGVLCVVTGYSASFGPLTWLLTSELFPTDIRGRALGVSTIVTYLCAFLTTSTFLTASTWLGANVFLLYAVLTLVGLVFSHLAVPDTADKTVNEIDDALSKMWWWTKRTSSSRGAVDYGTGDPNVGLSPSPDAPILNGEMT